MDTSSIETLLSDWTTRDLITPQQAEEILAFESTRVAAVAPPAADSIPDERPAAQTRVPIAGEILGYVGGALAIAALYAIVTQYWIDLGSRGQLGLAGLVSAVCMFGGWTLSALKPPQAKRLGGFLLFIATAAMGFFAGLAADVALFLDVRDLQFVVGTGVALLVGFGLWTVRRTSLQLVAVALALASFIPAVAEWWSSDNSVLIFGASYLVVGVIWVILGEMQILSPRTTAWVMGSLAIVSAPQIMALDNWDSAGGYWILGCVLALALLGAALWLGRGGPLGLGAAGIVVYVPLFLYDRFDNTLGVPIFLLVAGVLLVLMSAVVIVVRPRLSRGALQS